MQAYLNTKNIKRIGTISYYIIAAILVIAGLLFLATSTPLFGQVSMRVVQSGSMDPAIPVGSMVVSKKAHEYQAGDVITFGYAAPGQLPTMHRVIEVQPKANGTYYVTRGDANENNDPNPVAKSTVHDKVVFHVPVVGYVVNFAQTKYGFILLVVLPALFIIVEEFIAMGRFIARTARERKWVQRIDDEEGNVDTPAPEPTFVARVPEPVMHAHTQVKPVRKPVLLSRQRRTMDGVARVHNHITRKVHHVGVQHVPYSMDGVRHAH